MKKTIMMTIALAAFAAIAAPHLGPAPHRGPAPRPAPVMSRPALRPAPRPALAQHRHHKSFWGRGGRNFWPGFIGGVIGSSLIQPAPVIVAPPPPPGPYVRQVWIEGHYETQVINGIYTQVWIPGRWAVVR